MKKTLAALFGAGAVLLAAACGSSEGSDSTEETTTTTTSAEASAGGGAQGSTNVELGKSYDENCAALLPYLDELETWGQDRATAAQAVADAQQQLPEWETLSEDEKADTLRAIENAGKGQC
jgi:hypothetical protein